MERSGTGTRSPDGLDDVTRIAGAHRDATEHEHESQRRGHDRQTFNHHPRGLLSHHGARHQGTLPTVEDDGETLLVLWLKDGALERRDGPVHRVLLAPVKASQGDGYPLHIGRRNAHE